MKKWWIAFLCGDAFLKATHDIIDHDKKVSNRSFCFSTCERLKSTHPSASKLIRSIMFLSVVLSVLVLCSCTKKAVIKVPPKLPYKVENSFDKTRVEMRKHFEKKGVKLISLGQEYLISIPAYQLFPAQSPRIMWSSYALLNDVVCYLKQYRKISVHVTAFSSDCLPPHRQKALTEARARAVGDYLWSQGIDSRFIFTQGLGNDKPIMGTKQGKDASKNSRIEITFRNAVV